MRSREERIRTNVKPNGVVSQTINRDVTALRAVLSYAVHKGYLENHPLANLKPLRADDDQRVRFLEDDERARFLTALKRAPDYVQRAILIAYWTGFRRAEVFGLKWSDVDFSNRLIKVQRQTAKTNRPRHVEIHPQLAPAPHRVAPSDAH